MSFNRQKIKGPFNAYEGKSPFIFVSYKHADSKLIFPILEKFNNQGFNIWYDDGLQYGEDYDDLIDLKIEESSLFLICITERVINHARDKGEYMKKELDIAIATETPILPIFIHDVELKGKYRMHLQGKHSIFKFEYENEDEFISECIEAFMDDFGLDSNLNEETETYSAPENISRQPFDDYENEKERPEEYNSNNNIELLSKDDFGEETAVESMASELATAFKPSGDKNQGYILNIPFEVYEGDEPYIFVSYKHRDYEKVYPVLYKLHKAGINIWFDAGLPLGNNYDIQIANHIMESSLFVTFITEGAIECSNEPNDYMVKELGLAVHMRKECLPIYLDDVNLGGFYLMHYLGKHSILKYEYGDNEDLFIDACISVFKQYGIEPTKQ